MAHEIQGDCVSCGECVPVCPEGAITEKRMTFEINASLCTDCEACVDICPVDCIQATTEDCKKDSPSR